MTQYEFFKAIKDNETLSEEIRNHAETCIAKIEEDRAKAAEKRKHKADENLPLKNEIYECLLTNGSMVASEIAKKLTTTDRELTTGKASSMCRQMEEAGLVVSTQIKSPTSKSKVKQYTVVIREENSIE